MFFDILLLSVIVVTAYLGPMLLRRGGTDQRTYGWMLVINLAVALIAFASRQGGAEVRVSNLLGFVAIAAAVFLVMVPPVVRNLSHWAYRTDRLWLALRLAGLRETLQPGMGGAQERELFQSMLDVRAGRIDEAVAALRARRDEVDDPMVRRRLEERVVMTYLYARLWDAAIEGFEDMGGMDAGPLSPGTVAEMVWAYCETGQMEKAAELVERLEESPLAKEPLFAPLLHRARLVFLAFVGRTAAVDAIIAPSGLLGPAMPEAVRQFWSGVVRLNAGDRPGARRYLGEAARQSGRNRRVRELAEARLDTVDAPGVAGPHAYSTAVAELADRLVDLSVAPADGSPPAAPHVATLGHRRTPATFGLIAANVAVMGLAWAIYGATDSMGMLARAGNLYAGVQIGEWWRAPSSVFVHVGLVHLFLNMYGLWVLGRFVEQIFGTTRFFGIYMVAGIVGAVASHVFSGGPVSAGASGSVLGLAGALLVELGLHRDEYPRRWRTGLFRVLLFLTAANVAIGFMYPAIDQGAHIGGLVSGALMALWMSPRSRYAYAAPMRAATVIVAVVGLFAVAYAGFAVATTSYADTIAKYPVRARVIANLTVDAPELWRQFVPNKGPLMDDSGMYVAFEVAAYEDDRSLDAALEEKLDIEQKQAVSKLGFDAVGPAGGSAVALPEPWTSREFRVIARAPGTDRYFRMLVFGRPAPGSGQFWIGAAYFPEELAGDMSPVLDKVLRSARPTPAPLPATK